jgi:hypothetical protein
MYLACFITERPVADLHPSATHTLGMLNIAPTQLDAETREETTLKPYFLELCGMYSHYCQPHWVSLLVSHSPNQQRLISKTHLKIEKKIKKNIGLDRRPSGSEIILDPK